MAGESTKFIDNVVVTLYVISTNPIKLQVSDKFYDMEFYRASHADKTSERLKSDHIVYDNRYPVVGGGVLSSAYVIEIVTPSLVTTPSPDAPSGAVLIADIPL
ncbi:hypothetical protein J6590_025148 [Homalodisca vitripennis]|nr:hypothetical protein J6590_025148 [Homalodisca vitripennis]